MCPASADEVSEQTDADSVLRESVFCAGEYRLFGELTAEQIAAHGAELGEASGFGHGGRVAGVAAGWKELSRMMEKEGVAKVADLDAETVAKYSERLWIVPPGGSLL